MLLAWLLYASRFWCKVLIACTCFTRSKVKTSQNCTPFVPKWSSYWTKCSRLRLKITFKKNCFYIVNRVRATPSILETLGFGTLFKVQFWIFEKWKFLGIFKEHNGHLIVEYEVLFVWVVNMSPNMHGPLYHLPKFHLLQSCNRLKDTKNKNK